ncbi:MAG: hypothetical protein L0H36_00720 [bacterium]|nr:hypothetical protein [bacterium]MDN5835140.1 hypothetical protein [bacterium]
MPFGFLRRAVQEQWNEIYQDLDKKYPIKEGAMYSYPVAVYVFELKCQHCNAKWYSRELSSSDADQEQTRIQAQYKQHLIDFHPDDSK